MCGILGLIPARSAPDPTETLWKMAHELRHRGPDASGVWTDPITHTGLGNTRLAVIDLSPAGEQPMHSEGGRFSMVMNGEIYNHAAIRQELDRAGAAPAWRGTSDTEILVAAIAAWGLEGALARAIGMFAIALWDRERRELTLARDRLGEKPLYYGNVAGDFVFASELKALRVHPRWTGEVDRAALAAFMRYNYVPTPLSIYAGIRKLEAGSLLRVPFGEDGAARPVGPTPYWDLVEVARRAAQNRFQGSAEEAAGELEKRLGAAVHSQLVSDVPVGALLSGGIDSSTIVALMAAKGPRPPKTFTIGYHERDFNEADHARKVAGHLGTEHYELYVSPEEAFRQIPELPRIYDEPFADCSQIPMFLVSGLARAKVTVALSGDGGDELFGGYNRYNWASPIQRFSRWMPRLARQASSALLAGRTGRFAAHAFELASPYLPVQMRMGAISEKVAKLSEAIVAGDGQDLYRLTTTQWRDSLHVVPDAAPVADPWTRINPASVYDNVEEQMMLLDACTYLPDDILVKMDRAAMSVSLETRAPFLDQRVVEFALSLPLDLKIREGQGKWLLRQVLYRHVPPKMVERPKMGFGVPLGGWLRGPLRDWAESLLGESRLRGEGFLDPSPIRRKWQQHLRAEHDWQYHLWDVLMFQSWLEGQRT